MAQTGKVGGRIRDRRMDISMQQAVLAKAVGISASYLNLIEHNRRNIGGKLLNDLAIHLDVRAEWLANGAEDTLLSALQEAASSSSENHDLQPPEELAGRFPGWAALIVEQADRIASLQDSMAAVTDRITHDPALATALHEVISSVTAIRSSASILVGQEVLDTDWQERFHRNIYEDSRRLAENSETLVSYLEAPDTETGLPIAPFEEVQEKIAGLDFHIAELEGDKPKAVADIVGQGGFKSDASAALYTSYLTGYHQDAVQLPLTQFALSARENNYNPVVLSRIFNAPLAQVMRRLASLPPDMDIPPIGLVIVDAAGGVAFHKPVEGFDMMRSGGHCPLWPVFSALSRPDQPIRAVAALPSATQSHYQCYAVASSFGEVGFDTLPQIRATMLVIPVAAENEGATVPVGMACRICPRDACTARREPSIVANIAARL